MIFHWIGELRGSRNAFSVAVTITYQVISSCVNQTKWATIAYIADWSIAHLNIFIKNKSSSLRIVCKKTAVPLLHGILTMTLNGKKYVWFTAAWHIITCRYFDFKESIDPSYWSVTTETIAINVSSYWINIKE